MKISVFLERENKKQRMEIKKGDTISSLMKKLKINPVSYISTVNDEVVTEEHVLKDRDKVEILSVVSGG
ncbi:MAG TPA: MoaD/ThiS family protein [Candidatus Nanoarchaeia archaeon]|nr:MoaD/ThiS family protein [Candidatus Nanoarchaeia archaeon]